MNVDLLKTLVNTSAGKGHWVLFGLTKILKIHAYTPKAF